MLRKLHSLKSFVVHGQDGKFGKVEDFYFDQNQFIVRYLVVNVGSWLKHNQTLISTQALDNIDFDGRTINVDLTKEQLKNSPSVKNNEPISKAKEKEMIDYFGWPHYWSETHSSDSELIHADIKERKEMLNFKVLQEKEAKEKAAKKESNLRSVEELRNYKIHATDEKFGHLKDFFVESKSSWIIRYLLIDTREIMAGKTVLIAPDWIKSISWHTKEIFINKTKKEIEESPEYEEQSDNLIQQNYEEMLYDHYDEDKYW